MTARAPHAIHCRSTLSQDFVTSSGVVVDTTRAGQVAVFRNPRAADAVEALVISRDGAERDRLCHLARDAASLTGWRLVPLRGVHGEVLHAREVLAFATTWGDVDAYYVDAGGVLMHTWADPAKPGGWAPPEALGDLPVDLSQLRVAFSPGATSAHGSLVVSAVDPRGELALAWGRDGQWRRHRVALGGTPSSWTLSLVDETTWFLSLVAAHTFAFAPAGALVVETGQMLWCGGRMLDLGVRIVGGGVDARIAAARVLGHAVRAGTEEPVQLVTLDGAPDAAGGHAIGWSAWPMRPEPTHATIAGTSMIDAVAVPTADGRLDVYAIGASLDLFVIRPRARDADGGSAPGWGPVLQLDREIARVYAAPRPGDAPALMAADAERGELHLYAQDPATSLWQALPVRLPTASRIELDRWRTEVRVFDAGGQPIAGAALAITATSAVDLEINGRHHVVGGAAAATVTTNAFGVATLSSLATSLTPPALHVTAGAATATASPAGHVNAYLAGRGTLFGKPVFDAAAVARLAGPRGAIDPAVAAQAIEQCAALGLAADPEPLRRRALAATATAEVHVYTRSQGHRAFATRAEADAHVAETHRLLGGGQGTSIWDDVWDAAKRFAGDVWHAIREGIHAVESIVIDAARGAVQLGVWIEGVLVQLGDWIVRTVEDGLHAVTAVWNWLGAEVEAVIDFLKHVFDFRAIWNTKTFFTEQLVALPGFLTAQFRSWSRRIEQDFFRTRRAAIDGWFAEAIAGHDGRRFLDLPGWTPWHAPASRTEPRWGDAAPADLAHHPDGNWLLDKLISLAPADWGLAHQLDGGPFEAFLGAIVAAAGDLFRAFEKLGIAVQALLDPDRASSFQELAISTFLALAQEAVHLVLDVADALVQGLLALGELAMQGIAALLAQPLHLGFLGDVYGWIAGKVGGPPLPSVADLVALVAAFPVTVVWKLIAGVDSEPFPGGHLPRARRADGSLGVAPDVARAFGTAAGVLTILGGLWTAAGDAQEQPPSWFTYVGYGLTALRLVATHPCFTDWELLTIAIVEGSIAAVLWIGAVLYWTVGTIATAAAEALKTKIVGLVHGLGLTSWTFDDVIKIAVSAFGLVSLGASIYGIAAGDGSRPYADTGSLVGALSGPFAFLTMKPILDSPLVIVAWPVRLALDVSTSLGAGVFTFLDTWHDPAR